MQKAGSTASCFFFAPIEQIHTAASPIVPASAPPRQAASKKQMPWAIAIRLPSYLIIIERMNAMEILTNIIFLLNMLKTLINHFF